MGFFRFSPFAVMVLIFLEESYSISRNVFWNEVKTVGLFIHNRYDFRPDINRSVMVPRALILQNINTDKLL